MKYIKRNNAKRRSLLKKNPEGMLIYITPSFYSSDETPTHLMVLKLEELNLVLRNNIDIMTGRPRPNKNWYVACRKGRKALNGLLIYSPKWLQSFSIENYWNCGGHKSIQKIKYNVVDDKYAAVTDNMILWNDFSEQGGFPVNFPRRWPDFMNFPPLFIEPRMELFTNSILAPSHIKKDIDKIKQVKETIGENSKIVARSEQFFMPTIEPERILTANIYLPKDRIPAADTIFYVK